ncbi:krev interaction trapped protein 1 [Lingula anatina]|uniref:Krev interaction trapped protein 1 n=1 Tax=Lingula anatina TaxID=7574 RepID=A0A1S3H6I6_LINAN|nr:krev interaction trapped protein 1 [Lingula anatina]|eukprot:XP_013381091.1 krev interaction trapped protein 1 [Lingula anatina]
MDAIIAVLRLAQPLAQRPTATTSGLFEILLADVKISSTDNSRTIKQLPKVVVNINPQDEEPTDVIIKYVHQLTGGDTGGLRGLRSLFVPPTKFESGDRESFMRASLFCVPVDGRERATTAFMNQSVSFPQFHSLDFVLSSLNSNSINYAKATRHMVQRLDSWLKERQMVPGAIEALFRKPAQQRLGLSVFNPAFMPSSRSNDSINLQENTGIQDANDALAKMMAIEKCDIVVMNPLFGSGLPYKHKVDAFAINRYWGVGVPDYGRIRVDSSGSSSDVSFYEFPLHKKAYDGDADAVRDLIAKGQPVTQKDRNSWTPIHYAVWYGHLEVIQVLLEEGGCPPNITNKKRSTPLHFAALCGHPYVVELLLNHPDIDVHAVDKDGNTALNLCMDTEKPEHKEIASLLKKVMKRREYEKIDVHLMDNKVVRLDLVSGANTTVHQLHLQMLRHLEFPASAAHMFTIWICSANLQLQLRKEHRPVEHQQDWAKIVGMLTDCDPSKETPKLVWRRDARLSIAHEKKVRHPAVVNLLFHEAYRNYIKALYPCADQDAFMLGAILMQLWFGDYDQKKSKGLIETNIWDLVPTPMLKSKGVGWTSKIEKEYKNFTQQMSDKDHPPQILQYQFLMVCWNLVVYGAAFFLASMPSKSPKQSVPVYVGVNDIGVHVIHGQSKTMMLTFHYKDVEWFNKEDQPVLEIKPKASPKQGVMTIHTKQAGLIDHLMSKMAQIHIPVPAPEL